MIDLNDLAAMRRYDSADLLATTGGLAEQLRQGWENARRLVLPERYRQVERVIIAGMGGSAIGGDLLRSLVAATCPLPIVVVRDYTLPSWADGQTLVVTSSYSGNTEETLAAFEHARERGAAIVALTTGGKLAALAKQYRIPLLTFQHNAPPRTALGHSFVLLLALFTHLGLIPDPETGLNETVSVLQRLRDMWGEEVPLADNPAKALAQRLVGRFPVVFGMAPFDTVARRWKCQFNENSKTWASVEELPEADHNAVVGTLYPPDGIRQMAALFLAPQPEDRRHAMRRQVTVDILADAGAHCESLFAQGQSLMAQMFSLVLLGDYVTLYLALLQEVDPAPIRAIDRLKARLAALQSG